MNALVVTGILTLVGCDAAKTPPYKFLGLTEQQSRKIGENAPGSALSDVTDVTPVRPEKYERYLELKKAGKITAEDEHAGHIYFAIGVDYCRPFPNGSSAIVTVTERYKAVLPVEK